jgi:hypothetical protein
LTRLSHCSPTTAGWVLLKRGPRKPAHYPHHQIYPLFRISTHNLNAVEVWPQLKAGYVVLPVITSRPLRPPYAHRMLLAGFIQLDTCLPQAKSCGDAGISGLPSVICHRMWNIPVYRADGLTPGPCQVLAPFTSLTTLAFSLKKEDRLHSPGGLKKKTHILGIFFLDILLPSFYIRFILKQVLSGPSKLGASYGVQVSIG